MADPSRNARTVVSLAAVMISAVTLVFGCRENSILGEIVVSDSRAEAKNVQIIRIDEELHDGVGHATVLLNNSSESSIAIDRIAYTAPEAFSINSSRVPEVIASGKNAPIEIAFHPTEPGTYRTSVQIYLVGSEKPIEFVILAEI